MTEFFNLIGNILLFAFVGLLLFLYFKNIYKLFLDVQGEHYTVMTVLRVIGVFIVFLGVLMGLV